MDRNSEIVPSNQANQSITTSSGFQSYLKNLGLPIDGILASDHEREVMAINLPMTISRISPELKKDARYLSKFVASSAIGLYDAALNYLWNEVILSLREKVNLYGLDLFYDAAVGGELRETFSTYEDLGSIKDVVLIDTCKKLELISGILHEKLKHILFMRNHIGASHPTEESITTHELLGWLEVSVNQVIADRPSEAAIFIQQLVENLKKEDLNISEANAGQIKETLQQQNRTIAGNLLVTLFGIFTKKNTPPKVRENILKLAHIVWDCSSDEKRYEIGLKVDKFSINLDEETTALANSFLVKCDGLNYKSEGTKSREVDALLDRLLDVHHQNNNYHHEVPIAREIKSYIKEESDILPNFEDKLIENILICRIGNGTWYRDGVSPLAKPIYNDLVSLLNSKQVNKLVKKLSEPTIRVQLSFDNCRKQLKDLLSLINMDLQEPRTQEVIELILKNVDSAKNNLFKIKEIQECMKYL
ncbi:hypothetical protein [Paenibacillus massiliensis]|uniref:hypothetical protein n=1 Tax=Paenibacillus massiliensis TaxID=225917 RepID=UPI0004710D48|nr:hypothetical protein [Paenibacillus massiliensis]